MTQILEHHLFHLAKETAPACIHSNYEIKEGDKSRTQFFKGVVIQIKGTGKTKTFTIRKMSGTVGIERIFPINLPTIKKIEVNKKGKVRRSRIYYFKELRGKKARIKEIKK